MRHDGELRASIMNIHSIRVRFQEDGWWPSPSGAGSECRNEELNSNARIQVDNSLTELFGELHISKSACVIIWGYGWNTRNRNIAPIVPYHHQAWPAECYHRMDLLKGSCKKFNTSTLVLGIHAKWTDLYYRSGDDSPARRSSGSWCPGCLYLGQRHSEAPSTMSYHPITWTFSRKKSELFAKIFQPSFN